MSAESEILKLILAQLKEANERQAATYELLAEIAHKKKRTPHGHTDEEAPKPSKRRAAKH